MNILNPVLAALMTDPPATSLLCLMHTCVYAEGGTTAAADDYATEEEEDQEPGESSIPLYHAPEHIGCGSVHPMQLYVGLHTLLTCP